MTPGKLGFVQGLILAVVVTVIEFVANNIGASGLVSTATAATISGILLAIEHAITAFTGKALLGTTRVRV